MGKYTSVNITHQKARETTQITVKTDFKTKNITKDKKEHYIMIRGLIHQEAITIMKIYVSNNSVAKHRKQKNDTNKERKKSINKNWKLQYPTLYDICNN